MLWKNRHSAMRIGYWSSIGVAPRVELARAAGLAIDNGIVVDRMLRTEDPHIFAAGDVSSFTHDLFAGRVRLESWKNAEEQGPVAARNMLGAGEDCSAVRIRTENDRSAGTSWILSPTMLSSAATPRSANLCGNVVIWRVFHRGANFPV